MKNDNKTTPALSYHSSKPPGKLQISLTKPMNTQEDISLAYSPGVAEPCMEIHRDPSSSYDLTAKGNLVAVISNGTAVLGLGNIGALASKPVMEGKAVLFKKLAGIDSFDIEVDCVDPHKFIDIVEAISPTFGGINLEDIKAPESMVVEESLREKLNIPIMHDDRHGTAIISAAALKNACILAGKEFKNLRMVVVGAGGAALGCIAFFIGMGLNKEGICVFDSKGIIHKGRKDLNPWKEAYACDRNMSLDDALDGADVFLGLSTSGLLHPHQLKKMSRNPIVFALANPDPEIGYKEAKEARPDIIMATGRSDLPNQVNNVLGFPYIFRGALDARATAINETMKQAASMAIADLAHKPIPQGVLKAFGLKSLSFSPEYLIPKPMDPRLLTEVSFSVALAAHESGVGTFDIPDVETYEDTLKEKGFISPLG